jgi:hypothetical protein
MPALLTAAQAAVAGGRSVGVLVTTDRVPALRGLGVIVADLGPENDPGDVATRLYAALRELDAAKVDTILSLGFPAGSGLWVALRDRLRRAATHVVRIT